MSATSSAVAPVDAIIDLLEGADSSDWTNADPSVFSWWDRNQQERGPGDGQPGHLYVWMPVSSTIDRLSADAQVLIEDSTVEIWVFTLDANETLEYARDVIFYLSDYMNDNEQDTVFHNLEPTGVEDLREQKLTERTDHYVYTVEMSLRKITDTPKAP